MGAAVLNLRGRRRWSELSRVERVGLYTRQSLYLFLWLFNASVLLPAALGLDSATDAILILAGGLAVSACAFAAFVPAMRRWPDVPPPSWRQLGPLVVVGAAVLVFAETSLPSDVQGAAVFVVASTLLITLSLQPGNAIVGVLLVASALLFGLTSWAPTGLAVGLVVGTFFVFTVRASLWLLGIVVDLDEASQVKAELAVVEERLRFSRDVHDVLGRRLSTIAVQAELAATLASRGDERAAERMLEVRSVAHEALREARELARGYRATNFDTELRGAESLLRSAGIDVRCSGGDLPRAWHEAAGWVVREAVTNVLRHSRARCVEIVYADGVLRVDNDGARPSADGDGSGLQTLRERLAPLGADLEAGPTDDGHWVVTARLPGVGPLSARQERP